LDDDGLSEHSDFIEEEPPDEPAPKAGPSALGPGGSRSSIQILSEIVAAGPCTRRQPSVMINSSSKAAEILAPYDRDLVLLPKSLGLVDKKARHFHAAAAMNSLLTNEYGEHQDASKMFNADDRLKFFESHQRFVAYDDKKQMGRVSASDPVQAYVQTCDRLNITPRPFTVLKQKAAAVNLSHYGIDTAHAVALADSLRVNTTPRSVILNCNRLGDNGATTLAQALRSQPLHRLGLSGAGISAVGVAALINVLMSDSTLSRLDLGNNKIGDKGAAIIAQGLERNSTLNDLKLDHASIGSAGAQALAKLLGVNQTITKLDLSWNGIANRGAVELGEVMASNKQLRTLLLAWNGLATPGCIGFAQALRKNRHLHTLDISYNRIVREGAMVLAGSLLENESLMHLDISGNHIGLGGGTALLNSVCVGAEGKRRILMEQCSFAVDCKPMSYDPENPNGAYSFYLGDQLDRAQVEEMHRRAVKENGDNFSNVRGRRCRPPFPPSSPPPPPCTTPSCRWITGEIERHSVHHPDIGTLGDPRGGEAGVRLPWDAAVDHHERRRRPARVRCAQGDGQQPEEHGAHIAAARAARCRRTLPCTALVGGSACTRSGRSGRRSVAALG
jgi:hypothetical protein